MNIKQIFKLKTSHRQFSIIFTTLLYVVCNALNIDKISKWFYMGDQIDYSALIAYLLLGLGLFIAFFVLLAHRWTTKPLAITLVILSASATYFISKYNVAIDTSMISNMIHTDATEVRSLLSFQMIPYILLLMVLPILLILNTEINFHQPVRHLFSTVIVGASSLAIGIAFLYMEFNIIHRAGNISNKYIVHSLVPVNYLRSLFRTASHSIKPLYASNNKQPDISGRIATEQDLVVVLAIGETARQKSFSLYGYDGNNTNPVLSRTKDLHLLNGIARVGTTLYALPEILEKQEIKLPAIVSKLGINTACYVNYTLYDNCNAVGEINVTNCKHGKCYDEDVIPLLEANLKSYVSGYRFMVLHLGGGSHGPIYSHRHPPEFRQFKPMCNDADVVNQCTTEQIYNSYDNTILYTDQVLANIIQKLDHSGAPYVFIYLSDHGESLMEDDRIFHGMPPGIALPPEQAQIPLIVKSSIPISIVEREQYLQQDVFDTVLDLFSIETALFDKERSFIKKHDADSQQLNLADNH
ncbi:MAG: phosphoethanolamine transferase domain-containing protein [Gammaproteobacteria bacterium]|nr:phosphoethanolamine transferase domain-containing protein [Gammaproteobacteria bacterium]